MMLVLLQKQKLNQNHKATQRNNSHLQFQVVLRVQKRNQPKKNKEMVLVLLSNTIDTSQITPLTPHLKGLPQVQEVKTIKEPNKEKKVFLVISAGDRANLEAAEAVDRATFTSAYHEQEQAGISSPGNQGRSRQSM